MGSTLVRGRVAPPRSEFHRTVGSEALQANGCSEGISGRFDAMWDIPSDPTMRLDAIVEIPLRGEGQTVTGLGTVEQLRIPRADSARVLREPLDGADSLCLSVANLRNYRSQRETDSKNLKVYTVLIGYCEPDLESPRLGILPHTHTRSPF